MTMKKFTIYIVVGTGEFNHGSINLLDYKPSDSGFDNRFSRKIISTTEIEVDVPEFDIVTLEIESLEKAVQREKADSQVRVNLLLERISKLKAITHEVEPLQ